MTFKSFFIGLGSCMLLACSTTPKEPTPFQSEMEQALQTTLDMRNDTTGIWTDAGWWNSANVLTAVIRYGQVTGDTAKITPVIADVLASGRKIAKDFVNDYYDDEGWWVLAWIDAYRLTGKSEYLEQAMATFADMTTGWNDEVCGGGIWWKKPQQYKNSIANNLFSLSAARLYKETGDEAYRTWFEKDLAWFLQTGIIKEDTGLVDDGLKGDCTPSDGQTHTYNQGVAMASLTEMYLLTKDQKYLDKATSIADATITKMVNENGILKERYEPKLGADGIQFKGIFLRHLGFLNSVAPKESYKEFIIKNANSILQNDYDPASKSFGGLWYGPFDAVHSGGHSSALECVIEAYVVSKP